MSDTIVTRIKFGRCLNCDDPLLQTGVGIVVFEILCLECIDEYFKQFVCGEITEEQKIWLAKMAFEASMRIEVLRRT